VEDDKDRPVITMEETERGHGLFDITGFITVRNLHGVKADLGKKRKGVTLVVSQNEN